MKFNIKGYYNFRLDQNEYGGAVLLYVGDAIPSKLTAMRNSAIEDFLIELNLRRKKWLLCCTCNPNHSFVSSYLSTTGNNIDLRLANYENFFQMEGINVEFS